MGILDNLTPEKPLEPCRAIQAAIELDAEDARTLLEALEDPRWTPSALSNALRARGVTLAADTIRLHVRKVCRCSKI